MSVNLETAVRALVDQVVPEERRPAFLAEHGFAEGDTAYADMTKVELQEEADRRELTMGGTKADLIDRLEANDRGEDEE